MPSDIIVALVTTVGTVVVAGIAWLGGRRDARQKAAAESENARREAEAVTNERWEIMLASQREGFDALLVPLRDETRDLRGQVGELREEVVELRREVHARDGIISSLVAYVRTWRVEWRRHLPESPEPVPPETVAHLI